MHPLPKVQKDEEKEDEKFIDVVINKNMKLGQKVLIPVKQFPKVSTDDSSLTHLLTSTSPKHLADDKCWGHGQEEWTNGRNKAPPARTTKGVYRDQPYSRY
uniref:KH RNA binding domain containing, signal transduction associated 3 n=1 Tax=Astyanax mexicanus TaxID=7994 RepID=A0A8B9H867_ASTMX